MNLQLLKCKIHKARITETELEYEGSLSVDRELMELAGILPNEKLLVVNASNGARLETYAIPAPAGSRTFCLNGAAARLGEVGDRITVMAFASLTPEEAVAHRPRILLLDDRNEVVSGPGA
ncbi:MAG: aspartate 1-decarboxylase [Kiritimatiellaeota bacterium]|nr:aspartate 1-decarboxylase [Kiritimatiellota bacterium]